MSPTHHSPGARMTGVSQRTNIPMRPKPMATAIARAPSTAVVAAVRNPIQIDQNRDAGSGPIQDERECRDRGGSEPRPGEYCTLRSAQAGPRAAWDLPIEVVPGLLEAVHDVSVQVGRVPVQVVMMRTPLQRGVQERIGRRGRERRVRALSSRRSSVGPLVR